MLMNKDIKHFLFTHIYCKNTKKPDKVIGICIGKLPIYQVLKTMFLFLLFKEKAARKFMLPTHKHHF